ncbi:hypothetical protein TRICI_006852 [Trichomonascus ciferrii]|uniref:FMR1-interacting protein 1 conserved domain-containing protein n=1 Tax=Trichomonascus ciferrii TaxID=44093 RepID=A0A642UC61_9ASCO|nr:hypothetical protein TRICI_006852 [Trichomonascus ciferrii]
MEEYIYKPPPAPPGGGGNKPRGGGGGPSNRSNSRPGPYNKQRNAGPRKDADNAGSFDIVDEVLAERVKTEATDIEAWIAARKRYWPTDKRIKERQEQLEEKRQHMEERIQNQPSTVSKQSNINIVKPKRFEPPPSNTSLFKSLVQNDLDKENQTVLEFINYLYDAGIIQF